MSAVVLLPWDALHEKETTMSRGLGKVERQILAALEAYAYGRTDLETLAWLVTGAIAALEEDHDRADQPRCTHKAEVRYDGAWG